MVSLPHHIAIIMDGNGRWAAQRSLPRVAGHKVGVDSVRAVIKTCVAKEIAILTLFAFSLENWLRPQDEVNYLLEQLFVHAFTKELKQLQQQNIQIRFIGDLAKLNSKLQKIIAHAEKSTVDNSGLKLVIALSYSGQWDIVQALQRIGQKIEHGFIQSTAITPELVQQYVCLGDLPAPDFLIRTSGEQRLSNFMLWQMAYTELYFTDIFWPDFREQELIEALRVYNTRQRRFGKC